MTGLVQKVIIPPVPWLKNLVLEFILSITGETKELFRHSKKLLEALGGI
uniref:Putative cytoplasmic protein n=1 Tax=Nostoc flagelliforme str. Sunitezuoqi TaxID=676037 RepID=E7DQ88_9NOSO|nr:putative cytoplasmic protein [Nostoc flagelliforme str. Sunitezuoqi]